MDRNLALIVRTSLASFGALLISQARFVFLTPVFTLCFLPFVAFTCAYYLISLYVNVGTRGFYYEAHRGLVATWWPGWHASLDAFLPVCGEPIAILRNTWTHVFELARAYPGTATVYVLDDSADTRLRDMAADFGFTYLVRPNRGWMKKAGNLRYGFACSSGEFILILDADFAPRADLPAEMLPYLAADPSLGIIQSPQYFRATAQMSWMERGAGAVQELFYRAVQVSRDRHGCDLRGLVCDLPPRGACDERGHVDYRALRGRPYRLRSALRRWGLRYIPIPLAAGLCPSDPNSFLVQQYRWCAGSMSLLGSRKFWAARMRFRTRCCYFSGFCYYVHTAVFTFAAPAIPLVMLIVLPENVRLANYVFIAPSMIYNLVVFPAWHRCRFGPTALMAKLLYGWAHVIAIFDILRRKRMGWQTTGEGKRKVGIRRVWVGISIWNGGTGLAWVSLAVWRMTHYGVAFIPLLATGLLVCTITAMALGSRRNNDLITQGAAR